MARIQEQTVVIRLSKLIKTEDKMSANIMAPSIQATIEALVAELVDDPSVIVEIDAEETEN